MTIRRFVATKDNTISNALKSDLKGTAMAANMGASDILEVFSIYAQASTSSLEKTRTIIEFPINEITDLKNRGEIPESGVTYKLKLYNSTHSETVPKSFTLSVSPIIQEWSEGTGLDMETYRDLGASNWTSASLGTLWYNTGGTIPNIDNLETDNSAIPLEIVQTFDTGVEDLEIDITAYVNEWDKHVKSLSTQASASVSFTAPPSNGQKIKLLQNNGDHRIFEFLSGAGGEVTSSLGSTGNNKTIYVSSFSPVSSSAKNFHDAINNYSPFSASMTNGASLINIHQPEKGYFGNTIVSASKDFPATIVSFQGGTGLQNRGLMIRMSGSLEDGTSGRSYYTKRFFARGSQFFFKKPIVEAQWDTSKTDDRPNICKSSNLYPDAQNLNTIYFYNHGPNGLVNIPNTGSQLVVNLYSAAAFTSSHQPHQVPETLPVAGGVLASARTFITASKVETGVYSATFAYDGNKTKLYDVWSLDRNLADGTLIQVFTGSALTVKDRKINNSYSMPEYVTNITNLKQVYSKNENAVFRVYTRDKKWHPNIYSTARNSAPVSVMKNAYYKIRRPADNLTIINYSTGSTPEYSKMSYDASGSYFDLDMSILESNYLYEISFLYKYGNDFIEQKERFRFRVDP